MKNGRIMSILMILMTESYSIFSCALKTLNKISEKDLKIMNPTMAYVIDLITGE